MKKAGKKAKVRSLKPRPPASGKSRGGASPPSMEDAVASVMRQAAAGEFANARAMLGELRSAGRRPPAK
jgi:hypothetical protein